MTATLELGFQETEIDEVVAPVAASPVGTGTVTGGGVVEPTGVFMSVTSSLALSARL